jgi:hypothetical protein
MESVVTNLNAVLGTCGQLCVGKNFLHVAGCPVQRCVRPFNAAHWAAGYIEDFAIAGPRVKVDFAIWDDDREPIQPRTPSIDYGRNRERTIGAVLRYRELATYIKLEVVRG